MSYPSELKPFALLQWKRWPGRAPANYRFVEHDAGARMCCLYDLSQSERSRFPRLDIVPETAMAAAFGRTLTVIHAAPAVEIPGQRLLSQAAQENWDRAWRIARALLAPDTSGTGRITGPATHAIFWDPEARRERFRTVAARYHVPGDVVVVIFARFLRLGGTREAVRPRVEQCGGRVMPRYKSGRSPC